MSVWRLAAIGALAGITVAASGVAHAATDGQNRDQLGLVLEADAEFGGDNVVKVFFTNGDTQNIKAGQGLTLAAGAHYQPAAFPIDFAATVGYKFVTTAADNTDLRIERVVIKVTGTYALPHNLWADAGPVWHVGTKLKGDGFVPNIDFGDALGATVGFGWRWIGISYTNIHYSGPFTGRIDGSNVGVNLIYKF